MSTWLHQAGDDFDIWVNRIFLRGQPGQTVSLHAAEAAAAGKRWGCVLCAYLSLVVQWGHCAMTLAGVPTKSGACFRAGIGFLVAFATVAWAISWFWS